ncbi:ammonium transporter [Paracoccaceae bacterium GXU_MW_L88]
MHKRLATALILTPGLASAQVTDETGFIFNSLLFLIGGFLVFWMAAGFCMLEAGLVRSKNVTMQLIKNISLFSISAICYWMIGYMLMYPGDAWMMNGVIGSVGTAILEPVGAGTDDIGDITYASVGSDFFFQLMFCATTASIVSGTLAERIKLLPFLIFVVVLTALIYPIQASWKWGGGFLETMGFADFAGSTIVHSVGGWAALTGALILGPRIGKYRSGRTQPMPGSNLTLATLGTFILWMGWFGFNGASQLAMNTPGDVADISRIFANTNMAAAAGALSVLLLTLSLYGKPDLTMVLNGALAGLVAITGEPLTPTLGQALIIGAIGGGIVYLTVPLLDRLQIDDVVGAIPVHLCAGIFGTLVVAWTNPDASVITQIKGIAIVGAFVVLTSGAVWMLLKGLMGLRVSAEEEITGLDVAELGMEAYPDFVKH